MSVDVMSAPSYSETVLRWYKPTETTPFALCGHLGRVLVQVDPSKHGSAVCEMWFGDNGWEDMSGQALGPGDVIAFAIAHPPCDTCGGTGEVFSHAYDCDDDLCALNGDMHSCAGRVDVCACRASS